MNRLDQQTEGQLPRINSHNKSHRIFTAQTEIKNSDQTLSNKQLTINTRLNSERKIISSANSSKTVKYQATTAIYLKKSQFLEKQAFLIDREMDSIRQQIQQLRHLKKNIEPIQSSQVSKLSSRRYDDKNISIDTNGIENKIEIVRKKVDKELEKNRAIQREVDIVRREITTSKKLNNQLHQELEKIKERYSQEMTISSSLDLEIGQKNENIHRKKIEAMHKKSHLIKSYDTILRKLEQELQKDKTSKNIITETNSELGEFYLTDVYDKLQKRPSTEGSPKSKRLQGQIKSFKEKLEAYENQFEKLKEKTDSNNMEEVTQKFLGQYQDNFRHYQFNNEIFKQLEELKDHQKQLIQHKQEIKQQIQQTQHNRNQIQSVEYFQRIFKTQQEKTIIRSKDQYHQTIFQNLKVFIIDYLTKIPVQALKDQYQNCDLSSLDLIISEQNILSFLQEILKSKEQLRIYENKKAKGNPNNSELSINHKTIDEVLQQARKEVTERDKLLSREELLKIKDGLRMNKNKNANKVKLVLKQ